MNQTIIQRAFKPLKKYLPYGIANLVRSFFTALLAPLLFSVQTGHLRSSFQMMAVSKKGKPIPWYTFPCIDFLTHRSFKGKKVLEFGGGQSTLWWAERAEQVITFEGNKEWYEKIRGGMPANVKLYLVSEETASSCLLGIESVLGEGKHEKFDIIIIDGLHRNQLISVAKSLLAPSGVIICDDAEEYGFYEGFKESDLSRVDFWGFASGVVLPHCTSVFFRGGSDLFHSKHPIPQNYG
jgi:hypothetical protein